MDPSALLTLVERCAPAGVPHAPLAAIIRTASDGEALLLTMGGGRRGPIRVLATSREEAIELAASAMVARDGGLRVGLAQLSAAELAALQTSTADAFDPCRHVAAAGRLLAERIDGARAKGHGGEAAVAQATAAYATARSSPPGQASLPVSRDPDTAAAPAASERPARDPPPRPTVAPWDVYRASTGTSLLVYGAATRVR